MDGLLYAAKTVLLGLLVFMVWFLIRSEGRTVDFEKLSARVTGTFVLDEMQEADERLLRRLYGLNGEEWENWCLYTAKDNMEVEELLLLEAKSREQLDEAEQAAERRAQIQMENFEGYGPEQVQLVENRTLKVTGTYLIFAVGEHAEDAKEAFTEVLYR